MKLIALSSFFFTFILACGNQDKMNKQGISDSEKISTSLKGCPFSHLKAIFDCDGNKLKDNEANSAAVSWVKLSSKTEEHKKFNGIGQYGGCTGSLIDTETKASSSPAYILTNGHCISIQGGLAPSEGAFFDLNGSQFMTFDFYYDFEDKANREQYRTKKIRYATMDGTDVAIVELDGTTLQELQKKGIHAYKLSRNLPEENEKIENIGVPATGISDIALRRSFCTAGEKVWIKEHAYDFEESFRLKCNVLGGSSGSPVFAYEGENNERIIVAVINTTVNDNSEGQSSCSLNRPCEVEGDNLKTINTEINYMQSTSFLVPCFTDEGVFDKNLCQLKGVASTD